jgi:hypothetical protein
MTFARLLLATALCVPAMWANLIVNPGFETPIAGGSFQVFTNGQNIGGWTVINNSVLLLGNAYTEEFGTLLFTSNSGNQNLDITGAGNTGNGGVQQVVTTIPGVTYLLTFFIGNQDNSREFYTGGSQVDLLINGNPVGTFGHSSTQANRPTWVQFSHQFTASSTSTTIAFVNSTVGDNYTGLDDVSLIALPGADPEEIPEPSTFALGVAGLAVLWAIRRRR